MISRRSLLAGLLASTAAPAFVRFPQSSFAADIAAARDFEIDLLKQRMNDVYAVTRQNMARFLYANPAKDVLGLFTSVVPSDHWPCAYQTLDQSFWERAEQHYQRSLFWIEQGKPDYAIGSLRKAAKWEDRARSLP